jgi:hypothetical protein
MKIHFQVLHPVAFPFERCVPFQNPQGEQGVNLSKFGNVSELMQEVSYSAGARCSTGSLYYLKIDDVLISNNMLLTVKSYKTFYLG